MGSPGFQLEICKIAGPDSPRCVNSRSSRNSPRASCPVDRLTSSATPDSADNGCHCAASKVSGTSAGRGSTIFRPNWRAIFRPKSVAPSCGIAMPPVATTSLAARMRPWLVRSSKPCSPWAISATEQPMRQATRPSSHSARSSPMMDSLESSQNSWPRCFSCQDTRWRLSSARKSCGVARQRRTAEVRVLGQEVGGPAPRLVKLQRPPPEMRIFSARRSAWSTRTTRRPAGQPPRRTSCPRRRRPARQRQTTSALRILAGSLFLQAVDVVALFAVLAHFVGQAVDVGFEAGSAR